MRTFQEEKQPVNNPGFKNKRNSILRSLDIELIDEPIKPLIANIAKLPYCYTIQSCYGHFVHSKQSDLENLIPLDTFTDISEIEYRIAYLAFAIKENSDSIKLLSEIRKLSDIDTEYIHFGSADWFWERHLNSYVIQVEPYRFRFHDSCIVDFTEARRLENVKKKLFEELNSLFNSLRNSLK